MLSSDKGLGLSGALPKALLRARSRLVLSGIIRALSGVFSGALSGLLSGLSQGLFTGALSEPFRHYTSRR